MKRKRADRLQVWHISFFGGSISNELHRNSCIEKIELKLQNKSAKVEEGKNTPTTQNDKQNFVLNINQLRFIPVESFSFDCDDVDEVGDNHIL